MRNRFACVRRCGTTILIPFFIAVIVTPLVSATSLQKGSETPVEGGLHVFIFNQEL